MIFGWAIKLAICITIALLYRVLSMSMVKPLLESADNMKSGLLRTQIDAHFVVNTVDCIEKLIRQGKHCAAETAARNLTTLITSMHKSGEEISIDEEMDALLRYIEIMNIRSGDKYEADVDVDDELSAFMMPARVLQPLVENAVYHGFASVQGCRITVTGRLLTDCVAFEVADNGQGMQPEKLRALQEALDAADDWDDHEYKLKGVALLNIQRRVRALYGKPYGLTVESGAAGFRARIRLPIVGLKGD